MEVWKPVLFSAQPRPSTDPIHLLLPQHQAGNELKNHHARVVAQAIHAMPRMRLAMTGERSTEHVKYVWVLSSKM